MHQVNICVWPAGLIILALAVSQPCRAQDGVAEASRIGVVCGPNAALMFLVVAGVDVDDASVFRIPLTAQGASMLQLRDFCDTQGVRTEIRHFRATDINRIPLPAIWQSRRRGQHHYFVVYRIDSGGIFALDGTTGRKLRLDPERIDKFFTGYALVPIRSFIGHLLARNGIGAHLAGWLCALQLAVLGAIVVHRSSRGGKAERRPQVSPTSRRIHSA